MKIFFTTISKLLLIASCFVVTTLSAQNNVNTSQPFEAKDVKKAERVLKRGKKGTIGEKTLQDAQSIINGEDPVNKVALFKDAKRQPNTQQNITPVLQAQPNIQNPQQPSPEEIEKQRKAQLEAKKQQLQKTFFSEINPATDKIGETFFEKYKYWLIGGIIALITVLAFIFKPKKKPILTPYQEAVVRFQALLKIADALEVKPYAEEVSQIVRDYIDKVYSIPAPERTTQEFLEIAHQSKIFSNESKQDLAEILKLADMAKFAKHSFSKNERTQIFETSKKFVEDDNLRLIKEKQKSSKQ